MSPLSSPPTKTTICYICGNAGADSKDHVPPKCLLPPDPDNKFPRITVPAHRKCNSAAASDEEYVRDLLIQEAVTLGMPKVDELDAKVWRSWAKSGNLRHQKFILNSHPVELISKSGLFIGKAIGVVPDAKVVNRVLVKMARGIIYHDAGAVLSEERICCAALPVSEAMKLRLDDGNHPFWIGLAAETCLHSMFGERVALRRYYEGRADDPSRSEVSIKANIAIIAWNLCALVETRFPLSSCSNMEFSFHINSQDGGWVRGD